jgi:hypothetical protein
VTLKEARVGGEKQQTTLDESKRSLLAAKESLEASTRLLKNQVAVQENTLAAVEQADLLLHQTTVAAASQIQLLKSINDQPMRRGILAVSLECSDPDGRQQRSPLDLIGETENEKFHAGRGHSTFDLKLVEDAIYACKLTVRNIGNQKIEQFSVSPLGEELNGLEVSGQPLFGEFVGTTTMPPAFFRFTFGGTLLPVAQDPVGQSSEFTLKLDANHLQDPPGSKPRINFRLEPVNVSYDYVRISIVRLPRH